MRFLVFTFLLCLTCTSLAQAGQPTPARKPAKVEKAAPAPKPQEQKEEQTTQAVTTTSDDAPLDVVDNDEKYDDLPDYPLGARTTMGEMTTYIVQEEDTFLDIARHFGLGYVELRAANPGVDPWAPIPGSELVIPAFTVLPRARQDGIVVNLGDMRMYYFKNPGKPPLTYALGIGREGLQTPTGTTTIVRKAAGPSWFPTERMRKEKPFLPVSIPPGPSNPLGTHAMYLGWPTFLIHGSNKPWGIGRRVSSGCMRMYPEDIISLFGMVPVGTKVTVVDQPILVAWTDDGLYLEANPSKTQSNEIEIEGEHTIKPLSDEMRAFIKDTAGPDAEKRIDWDVVEKAVRERRGYPVLIATPSAGKKPAKNGAHTSKTKDATNSAARTVNSYN